MRPLVVLGERSHREQRHKQDASEALPFSFEALPASSEAIPASSKGLPNISEAIPTAFAAFPALWKTSQLS